MMIRPACLADLNACLALDADSQTDHVWQMEQRQENHSTLIRFQTVRLPRVMHVSYPRQRDDLFACWQNGAAVFVAADKPIPDPLPEEELLLEPLDYGKIFAYCQLNAHHWQKTAWITHLIVNRPFRRHSIGTALIKASIAWAKNEKLSRIMIAVQTKNYPAISFCEKLGFSFCGFNDYYFTNRDIALFFTLKV